MTIASREEELEALKGTYRRFYLAGLGLIGAAMLLLIIGMRLSSIWFLIISLVLVIVSFVIIMRANIYRFAYVYSKKRGNQA